MLPKGRYERLAQFVAGLTVLTQRLQLSSGSCPDWIIEKSLLLAFYPLAGRVPGEDAHRLEQAAAEHGRCLLPDGDLIRCQLGATVVKAITPNRHRRFLRILYLGQR